MKASNFLRSVSVMAAIGLPLCPANAESILDIIERNKTTERPAPPATFDYNYAVDYDLERVEGKETVKFQARYIVNPNAQAGSRVTVETASMDDYPEVFTKLIEELNAEDLTADEAAKELWCGVKDEKNADFNLEDIIADEGVEVLSENDKQAVLSLPMEKLIDSFNLELSFGNDDEVEPSEDGELESDTEAASTEKQVETASRIMRRLFKRMKGEITLDKPNGRPRNFHMWLPKSMRIMLIAKLKKLDVSFTCDPAPNGFLYKTQDVNETAASALGNKVYSRESSTVTIIPNK